MPSADNEGGGSAPAGADPIAPPPAPTFKKRGAGGKNFRRRGRGGGAGDKSAGDSEGVEGRRSTKEADSDGGSADDRDNKKGDADEGEREGEDEDGSRMDLLADLREEQRARRKGGGRSVSALMGGRREKEKNPLTIMGGGVDGRVAEPPTESFGLKPEVKAPNISNMIESAFKSGGTGGWGAAADSAGVVPHEQLMEQYVKDKMGGEEAGGEEGGGGNDGNKNDMLSEEDQLYTIPEEFKRKVEEAKLEFDTGAKKGDEMDGEVGSGAQIAWNTGLAEIALPIEFKLKNMEDTLAARNKLDSVRAARRNAPGASSSLSGSLTANYSHHQKEWAMQIRELQNRQAMAEESQTKTLTKSGPGMAAATQLAGGNNTAGRRDAGRGGSGRDDGYGRGGGGGRGGGDGYGRGGRGEGPRMGPGGVKLKHSSDNAVLERFKKRTRRF